MSNRRNLVQRDALGVLFLVGSFYVLWTSLLGWELPEVERRGYLYGVLQRASVPSFSGALLCAVITVPIHASLYFVRRKEDRDLLLAYDELAAWAQVLLTSLGFLGTVVGISLAVGGLEDAMLSEEPSELVDGLSIAFDTTFLGLCGSLVLMITRRVFQPVVPRKEDVPR